VAGSVWIAWAGEGRGGCDRSREPHDVREAAGRRAPAGAAGRCGRMQSRREGLRVARGRASESCAPGEAADDESRQDGSEERRLGGRSAPSGLRNGGMFVEPEGRAGPPAALLLEVHVARGLLEEEVSTFRPHHAIAELQVRHGLHGVRIIWSGPNKQRFKKDKCRLQKRIKE
jgi:hypothetical protein